mmetsp:Transcript_59450/g.130505  ORF Transcript_59450/g.130505 Transcript_59450/m.130505 type:complete len:206 (+) Transcript_59450:1065-1682(+)
MLTLTEEEELLLQHRELLLAETPKDQRKSSSASGQLCEELPESREYLVPPKTHDVLELRPCLVFWHIVLDEHGFLHIVGLDEGLAGVLQVLDHLIEHGAKFGPGLAWIREGTPLLHGHLEIFLPCPLFHAAIRGVGSLDVLAVGDEGGMWRFQSWTLRFEAPFGGALLNAAPGHGGQAVVEFLLRASSGGHVASHDGPREGEVKY